MTRLPAKAVWLVPALPWGTACRKHVRGVSLLTAAVESVVVQTPGAVGRTVSSTTGGRAPSQRPSSRPVPPLDVPLTVSARPAGSTNTSTDGSVTGWLIVVAGTAAPAATGGGGGGANR